MSGAGYILDFTRAASTVPSNIGEQYIPHDDWKLHDPFLRHVEKKPIVDRRVQIAEPVVLGEFNPKHEEIAKVYSRDGIKLKSSGDLKLYLPESDVFALPFVKMVGDDVLRLYGSDAFKKAVFTYVVSHEVVQPNHAQREEFDTFHDHVRATPHPADLIYTFHTVLPTQFKLQQRQSSAPENAVCRFGGEILHRSVKNEGAAISRLWGAIIVEREETYRALKSNSAREELERCVCIEVGAREDMAAGAGRSFQQPVSIFPDLQCA